MNKDQLDLGILLQGQIAEIQQTIEDLDYIRNSIYDDNIRMALAYECRGGRIIHLNYDKIKDELHEAFLKAHDRLTRQIEGLKKQFEEL